MSEDRFQDLLGCLLDGEMSTDELAELVRLAKDDPSRRREIQIQLEAAEMIALAEDDLRDSALFASALRGRIFEDPFVSRVRLQLKRGDRLRRPVPLLPWGVAAAAVLAFVATGGLLWQTTAEATVAELIEVSGPIQWTGDGGQVDTTPKGSRRLSGGTLESLAPDASATIRFLDGTAMTISGQSTMTISAERQKIVHLRRGSLSANVTPQPAGRPLVLVTPTAELQVESTRFRVSADASQTTLAVSDGRVRVERLTDGRRVHVPAAHGTVASLDVDQELRVLERAEATHSWRANLEEKASHGKWIDYLTAYRRRLGHSIESGLMTPDEAVREFEAYASRLEDEGGLRAAPKRFRSGSGSDVHYIAVVDVALGQAPVVLAEGSSFRVRGRVKQPADLEIGLGVGDLGGGALARSMAPKVPVRDEFEVVVPLADFRPFDGSLAGRELFSWWGSTLARGAELEITGVELFGS